MSSNKRRRSSSVTMPASEDVQASHSSPVTRIIRGSSIGASSMADTSEERNSGTLQLQSANSTTKALGAPSFGSAHTGPIAQDARLDRKGGSQDNASISQGGVLMKHSSQVRSPDFYKKKARRYDLNVRVIEGTDEATQDISIVPSQEDGNREDSIIASPSSSDASTDHSHRDGSSSSPEVATGGDNTNGAPIRTVKTWIEILNTLVVSHPTPWQHNSNAGQLALAHFAEGRSFSADEIHQELSTMDEDEMRTLTFTLSAITLAASLLNLLDREKTRDVMTVISLLGEAMSAELGV